MIPYAIPCKKALSTLPQIRSTWSHKQGYINRSNLPTGLGARRVSWEHVENMELRCALVIRAPVCSVLCVSEHRALCLRAPCSVSQSTVLCVTKHCALGLRALCSGSQTTNTMLSVSEIIHYSLHVCWREVKNSLFPSDTLIYGICRDGSKNYNIRTWEHMTRGQFRLGARATINVALASNSIQSLYAVWCQIITIFDRHQHLERKNPFCNPLCNPFRTKVKKKQFFYASPKWMNWFSG